MLKIKTREDFLEEIAQMHVSNVTLARRLEEEEDKELKLRD